MSQSLGLATLSEHYGMQKVARVDILDIPCTRSGIWRLHACDACGTSPIEVWTARPLERAPWSLFRCPDCDAAYRVAV